jgi:hypothetical protein
VAAQAEARALAAEQRSASAEESSAALVAELELARMASTAPIVQAAEGSSSELEARLAELEAARRKDIAELQRAQEALANTQFELANANRRLKEAGERAEAGERSEGAGPEARPAPQPERVRAADRLRREPVSPPQEPDRAAPTPEPEPKPEEAPEEEGLSLRERLARAAAARHRGGLP